MRQEVIRNIKTPGRAGDLERRTVSGIRHAVTVLSIALIPLLLSGCGLPNPTYLAPPLDGQKSGTYVLSFLHDSLNNNTSTFLGYNLYYKFYNASDAAITTDQTAIDSTTTPGTTLLTSSLGFREMYPDISATSTPSDPLVPFDSTEKAQGTLVTLDFTGQTGGTAELEAVLTSSSGSVTLGTVNLKRNNPAYSTQTTTLKSFLTNDYLAGDDDISSWGVTVGSASTDYLVIAVVAVSYGLDLSTFTPLYSTPVYLGAVNLNYGTFASVD